MCDEDCGGFTLLLQPPRPASTYGYPLAPPPWAGRGQRSCLFRLYTPWRRHLSIGLGPHSGIDGPACLFRLYTPWRRHLRSKILIIGLGPYSGVDGLSFLLALYTPWLHYLRSKTDFDISSSTLSQEHFSAIVDKVVMNR